MPPSKKQLRSMRNLQNTKENRKLRARRRFRAAIRFVMINLFWLQERDDDAGLGGDVQKNVHLLLSKKKKKSSLLTKQDKIILSKPAHVRTDEEKNLLFRIIGGLKCFRKYRADVKYKLASVTYFVYYPPGRVIVKQFREGTCLYFIMSGEVAVSITAFDHVLQESQTIVVGTMVAGQMFGEVSLLHDIPRTATITTLSKRYDKEVSYFLFYHNLKTISAHCELIVLMKDDFNVILKSSLQEEWDEILHNMKRFTYFDGFDEVSNRECCIYSKIVTFEKGEILYGTGGPNDSFVYFILDGECTVIEELHIVETKIGNKPFFKLFDMEAYKKKVLEKRRRRSSQLTNRMSRKSLSKRDSKATRSSIKALFEKSETLQSKDSKNIAKQKTDSTVQHLEERKNMKSKSGHRLSEIASSMRNLLETRSMMEADENFTSEHNKLIALRSKPDFLDEHELNDEISEESSYSLLDINELRKLLGVYQEKEEQIEIPPNVKVVTMQVCIFSSLGVFGLGETLKYRIIVADRDCKCLMVPKSWLFLKNKGNEWFKILAYLKHKIPSTKTVFKRFLEERRWHNYKRDLVNHIRGKPPCNIKNNVPFSIRLREDLPYGIEYH